MVGIGINDVATNLVYKVDLLENTVSERARMTNARELCGAVNI
jgi:hypothetical protein